MRPTSTLSRRVVIAAIALVLPTIVSPGLASAAVALADPQPDGPLPVTAPPGHATAATPATPAGLPAGIEDPSGYVPQVSCDPVAKPGVLALAHLLVTTYPGTTYGITRPCGVDGMGSEHYEGRAIDWMRSARNPAQAAQVAKLLTWLLTLDDSGRPFANARRLGVMYLIWNNKIWGSYAAAAGWRPYGTCAAHPEAGWDTSCHRDHVHVSLSWAGAQGRTSFWTKTVAGPDYGPCRLPDLNWAAPYTTINPVPCPGYPSRISATNAPAAEVAVLRFSGAQVAPGSSGPVVRVVQQVIGAPVDGSFGPVTASALTGYQRSKGLPPTGIMDVATWRAVLLQFSPSTISSRPGDPGPVVDPGPQPAPSSGTGGTKAVKANPLTRYVATVLLFNARGPAVKALQRVLRLPVSGWFGPVTKTKVVAFQKAHRLPVTGVVERRTWRALGA